MSFRSALYVGSVMHRRLRPRVHRFRYRAFWLLLDLDEVPHLARRLRWFSHNSFNLFSLHDADHGDGSATPLRLQVEQRLSAAGIDIDGGMVRLFCMPRTLDYGFNPLSVFFCHHADGTLAAMLYEVHNTFGERHSYLIPVGMQSEVLRQSCRKTLYVSPFLEMDMRYEFRVTAPSDRVVIGIVASAADKPVITACLAGQRKDLNDRALLAIFLAIPAITAKVMLAIHWEALRLWLKGLRPHPRPARSDPSVALALDSSLDGD